MNMQTAVMREVLAMVGTVVLDDPDEWLWLQLWGIENERQIVCAQDGRCS